MGLLRRPKVTGNCQRVIIWMHYWRRPATDGAEFWISCTGPAFLSSFSHLQVIQNKRPWCWVAAYVTAGYLVKQSWKFVSPSAPHYPIPKNIKSWIIYFTFLPNWFGNSELKSRLSSCHICRIPTPGALILNHLQEAKTTEKSWSLTNNSKFNAICCWDAAVLHPNEIPWIFNRSCDF